VGKKKAAINVDLFCTQVRTWTALGGSGVAEEEKKSEKKAIARKTIR